MAQVQETVQTREGGQGAELGQSSPAEEEDGVAPGRGHCPLAERKILRAKAQQTWSRFNRGESGGLADVPVGRRSPSRCCLIWRTGRMSCSRTSATRPLVSFPLCGCLV